MKRIIVLLFLIVFCLSCYTVRAAGANDPMISADIVSANPGSTVSVRIIISNNPGLVSATIRVSFDSKFLSLTKVSDAGILGNNSHKPEYESPYTLAWVNDTATKNFTASGTVATLTFKVSSKAKTGESYQIRISYNYDNYDIYDKDLKQVRFQTIDGIVKISNNHSYVLGDANKDSRVNGSDTKFIQEYVAQIITAQSIDADAADVDIDGQVSIIDVTSIQRYLSNQSVRYPIGKRIG